MVYLTQLVYVNPGKESMFDSFEDVAIPLIAKHRGELLLRVRPTKDSIVAAGIDVPYEIHFVRFRNEDDFEKFSEDDVRQQVLHLKDQSVRAVILVKGTTAEGAMWAQYAAERSTTMRKEALLRAGGWAAIVAGVLRAAGAFTSDIGNDVTQQSLYLIIDVFLLIGVLAAYARDCEVVGRWGATGFLTALVGILLVRSSRVVPGLDLYPAGAVAVALGCALLGLTSWRAGTGSWWVPLLFILSVVTAIGGQAVTLSPAPFIVSGVIFGAAMVGLGKQVLDRRSSSGG